MQKKARFAVLLIFLSAALIIFAAGCAAKKPELATVSQVERFMPKHIRDGAFGLYFYDDADKMTR
jgi:hypothetical protein